jgi:glucose-6-phosphate 1-epimerase
VISDSEPFGPCTPVRIRAADGARLVACAHGGQVVGWIPAGEQRDRLWLSPLARCGPGEAIRGGIPVIFPQFAGRGPLPKHGLARDRTWELDTGTDGAPVARTAGRLQDDDATRAVWPHRFTLSLVAEAVGRTLTLTLEIRNDDPPGTPPFTLTAALHSYLAVDAQQASVHGLDGMTAEDNAAAGAAVRLPDTPLPALGPRDLAVAGIRPVRIVDGAGGELLVVGLPGDDGYRPPGNGGAADDQPPDGDQAHHGFDSIVVWNPGDAHGLADVPPDGARRFVCVEPARLVPVSLEPQGLWRARARLEALVPSP